MSAVHKTARDDGTAYRVAHHVTDMTDISLCQCILHTYYFVCFIVILFFFFSKS